MTGVQHDGIREEETEPLSSCNVSHLLSSNEKVEAIALCIQLHFRSSEGFKGNVGAFL
jgi:hypothetical protein